MPHSLSNVLVLCDKSLNDDGICPVSNFLVQNTISRGKEKDAFTWYLLLTGTGATEVKVTVVDGLQRL